MEQGSVWKEDRSVFPCWTRRYKNVAQKESRGTPPLHTWCFTVTVVYVQVLKQRKRGKKIKFDDTRYFASLVRQTRCEQLCCRVPNPVDPVFRQLAVQNSFKHSRKVVSFTYGLVLGCSACSCACSCEHPNASSPKTVDLRGQLINLFADAGETDSLHGRLVGVLERAEAVVATEKGSSYVCNK